MTPEVWKRLAAGALTGVLLCAPLTPAAARQDGGGPDVGLNTAMASRGGTVTGRVARRDDSPVSNAQLQLRDIRSGKVTQATEGDELGRFTFTRVEPGTYVVELVNDRGNVLALGPPFAIGPAETVATLIRVGTSGPWYDGFFSNAAAAAIAAAATLGVTALGNGGQPASARS
jgi:hypothetical protein